MDNNFNTLNRFEKKINSLSMNKDNLKQLCRVLQERADSAAELEVSNYKKLKILMMNNLKRIKS